MGKRLQPFIPRGRHLFLTGAILVTTWGFLSSCATPPPVVTPVDEGMYAPNIHDGRFYNPWRPLKFHYRALWDQLFVSNPHRGRDYGPVPRQTAPEELLQKTSSDAITWIGHATFLIQDGKDHVLTDPHLSDWALLAHRKTAPGIALDELPQPTFAVISHNHYDHLDEETIRNLPAEVPYLVPMGLANWFRELGRENVFELDWWDSITIGDWTAHCVPVQHWSRRIGQPTNSTLWCGWVLESPRRQYFFAGDTGYFAGFREIARRYGPPDIAMLPIGAYYPESFLSYQHMSPAEALQAFDDLGAERMLPMHWGTFRLTLEPIAEPAVKLRQLAKEQGRDLERLRPLALGETIALDE